MDKINNSVKLYTDSSNDLYIYGIVEATISDAMHQKDSFNAKKGVSAIGFQTAWFSGNRLGFDMEHKMPELGKSLGLNNFSVIAKLESEYELPTGFQDTPGVLFNRDAWVGFQSDELGKLTLGRQNALARDVTGNWGDAYGSPDVSLKEGGYSNKNMFKNFIYYSAGPGGTRNNSSIVWKKLIGDHWFVGANYAFGAIGQGASDNGGGGTPGQFTNGSGEAFSVAYNKLDVGPGYFDLNATYTRANISNLINQAELFGGNYVFGIYRLNAGYVHYTGEQGISKGVKNAAGTRTDNSWTASGSVLITPKVEVALGYTRMQGNHACVSGTVKNPMYGDASACTLSNIVSSGGVGTIFDSIIYHADKQIDIYLASDYTMVSGGWVVSDAQKNGTKLGKGQLYNSELEIATGVRFKF